MRLAQFISSNMQPILANWEGFAATRLPAASHMKSLELRDHARQILEAVVADLKAPQTDAEQDAKSKGRAPTRFRAPDTAAQIHAVLRAKSGFDINQLASEYRALRASVLDLWIEACGPAEPALDDVIRFNEAIDQALAESIDYFSAEVEQSRNLLLGMLGHDLRSPLQTIQVTAQYLRALDARPEVSQAAQRLINSGARMQALLNDLLDYNRTKLGLGIQVTRAPTDLGALCAAEIDQVRAINPGKAVELEIVGDCEGEFDKGRMQQLLSNLLTNAVNYGAPGTGVYVTLVGGADTLHLTVSNTGRIEPAMLHQMFDPLKRGTDPQNKNESGLGLGLYIASEVVKAHGGRIEAISDQANTRFAVQLPRRGATDVARA